MSALDPLKPESRPGTRIDAIGLTRRAEGVLRRKGITTVEALRDFGERGFGVLDLKLTPGVGKGTLAEILKACTVHGIRLPGMPAPSADDIDRRAILKARLLAFVATAPIGEVGLLARIAERIERGRRVYGEWIAANENRDLPKEQREELLDGLVYGAMMDEVGEEERHS